MTENKLSTSDLANASEDNDSDDVEEAPNRETSTQTMTGNGNEIRPNASTATDDSAVAETDQPESGGPTAAGRDAAQADENASLLPADQSDRFTARWHEIQTSFVDQPRDSVAQADALVADLMQRLAAGFSNERQRLESQWDSGDDVSTEDLRVALTRYRSFFDRLLSA